ncbi:Uncharacterised protein [Yersinia intermedia]|uniref:putative holin n=1 Tax=Yersinia intermedia TaxID=631 RepID=UPI0005DE3F1A|nr:Uncharacterised protein [Yersinia intermedia]
MAEPVTTTTAAVAGGAVTGIAVMTFFAGLPADVVLGAFAGAILFVASASEYGIRSRMILAIGSFIAGITMYKPAASMIIAALHTALSDRSWWNLSRATASCRIPLLQRSPVPCTATG